MLPKRKYAGRIPITRKTVAMGTARAPGGRYPAAIPIRQKTVPREGTKLWGAPYGTIRARSTITPAGQYPGRITLRPRPSVTIAPRPSPALRPRPGTTLIPRPTPTLTARPITTITSIVPRPKPPGHYPAAIPMGATGSTTGGPILPTANGLGLPAINGRSLSGIGNSISTGVGGILSVGRSYVPLAIKVVAGLVIIKLALWIFRRR